MGRNSDAILVSDGASNPIAVANAVIRAIKEVQDEGGRVDADPAIHLMMHQLTHLTGARTLDSLSAYSAARTACGAP